jgi:hypothetical protein
MQVDEAARLFIPGPQEILLDFQELSADGRLRLTGFMSPTSLNSHQSICVINRSTTQTTSFSSVNGNLFFPYSPLAIITILFS